MPLDLDRPLKDHLRPPLPADRLEALCERIEASSAKEVALTTDSAGSPRRRGLAVAAALLIVLGAGLFLLRPWDRAEPPSTTARTEEPLPQGGPLRLAGGGALDEAGDRESPSLVSLDDGSELHLSAGARLRATRNGRDRVELEQAAGRVTFEVRPGGERRWLVRAGEVEVEVVGTVFTIDHSPGRATSVEVTRGAVQVRSSSLAGGERLLRAGQRLALSFEAEPPPERERPEVAEVEEAHRQPSPRQAPDQRGPSWRELARDRRFAEAFSALGPGGAARAAEQAASVDDLFLLADVARLSGHPSQAVAPLERIVDHHSADRRAGLAAFTLGRLQLSGQPSTAAESFRRALRLGLGPTLSEDARARIVEALHRAGRPAQAREAAEAYLRDYPRGRRADQVRRWGGLVEP